MSGVALSLAGKVAVVSGGARGIGAATVRLLVAAGAKVMFNFVQAAGAAQALVEQCGEERAAALACALDTPAAGAKLLSAAVQHFGGVDILVANHGVWPAEDVGVDEMDDARWRHTLAVNLDGVFGLVKHAVAQMKRQGRGGHLVLVSSTAGQRGEAFHCDYAASKGAIISMTKGLATELAPERIYVNCVAPGWVDTDMAAPALAEPAQRAAVVGKIPLGRVATPEEIAAPIVFLCTNYAGFITGEIVNVNGGAVLVG